MDEAGFDLDSASSGYEFFREPESREELFTIGKTVADYLHSNNVNQIVFLDRSARPAYIALREY